VYFQRYFFVDGAYVSGTYLKPGDDHGEPFKITVSIGGNGDVNFTQDANDHFSDLHEFFMNPNVDSIQVLCGVINLMNEPSIPSTFLTKFKSLASGCDETFGCKYMDPDAGDAPGRKYFWVKRLEEDEAEEDDGEKPPRESSSSSGSSSNGGEY
jgi:hypothetical protein